MLSGSWVTSDCVVTGYVSSRSGRLTVSTGQIDGETGRDDSLEDAMPESGVIGGLSVSALPPIAAVMSPLLDICRLAGAFCQCDQNHCLKKLE